MERPGFPAREPRGESRQARAPPARQPAVRPRRDLRIGLERLHHPLDPGREPFHRTRARERAAPRGVRPARESLEPFRPQPGGHSGGAESAGAQERGEHLAFARGAARPPQRPRVPARLACVGAARPHSERGLEPAARHAQVVELRVPGRGPRLSPTVRRGGGGDGRQALAKARGGCRGARVVHATGPATFRVRSPATRVHSSSVTSSTCSVASRVWNPYSRASPSSSRMMRDW